MDKGYRGGIKGLRNLGLLKNFRDFRGFRDFDGFKENRFKGIGMEMNGSKDI